MAQSAQRMGFKVAVLDPDDSCPARFVAHHFVHAPYNDIDGLKELSSYSDVITYEFENINAEALEVIAKENHVPQGFETVNILQNRLSEKEAIAKSGATVVPYKRIEGASDVDDAIREIGLPLVLKTVFGGYDGKGQLVVTEEAQPRKLTQWLTAIFLLLRNVLSLTVRFRLQHHAIFRARSCISLYRRMCTAIRFCSVRQ